MRTAMLFGWLVVAACGSGGEGDSDFGSMGPAGCVPGEQRTCGCPGGAPDGVQVCAPTGDMFMPCVGCPLESPTTSSAGEASSGDGGLGEEVSSSPADATTTMMTSEGGEVGEGSSSGAPVDPCDDPAHCSNGAQDCGEPFTDCGGDCPETAEYTLCDCMIDTPRNGSEVCDDTGFQVGEPLPNVLVCLEATGGQIYVATNTAIDPTDMAMRCSGWELTGQKAWEHLDYVVPALTCDAAQKTMPFDISGYVGETLWFGAHDHPMGGGGGTTACIARMK
ncbi:MAG: hypothetical protein JNL82_21660 [Myxococcales bacterium]|nr:hypothetical protein [Myxococcales bacterium]